MLEVDTVVLSFYEDISQLEQDTIPPPQPYPLPQPYYNMKPLSHLTTQMQEFKIVIYDRVHDLVAERLITFDTVARQNDIGSYMKSIMELLKKT